MNDHDFLFVIWNCYYSLSKNPIGDEGFIKVLDAMEKYDSGLKGLG